MEYDLDSLLSTPVDLLAFGEPTHLEPAFGRTRNELLAELAGRGFRSIALETDRVAALAVDDYVRAGVGSLDGVMAAGFSHGFGELDANRALVARMRDYNENRPPQQRLAFYGFDAPLETMNAPSPRRYLEYARDYLGATVDMAGLLGADERWHRSEALLDPAESPGAGTGADTARVLADDMLPELYRRAPELIAKTSLGEWLRAEAHLTAGLGLLRYHRQAARPGAPAARWTTLCATRDALMARNLLDIRRIEAGRGPTLVSAHNLHLQRNVSGMRMGEMELEWSSAGAVVAALMGARYAVIVGTLGRDGNIGLGEPDPGTYEGFLQTRVRSRGLVAPGDIPDARVRADHTPAQGYFPLDRAAVDAADLILHITDGAAVSDGTGAREAMRVGPGQVGKPSR